MIRDIESKLPQPDTQMATLLERAKQIKQQQRSDSHQSYSMHVPEVECIAKGKVNKRYEFGCKGVLVTTSTSNWVVGATAVHGNPYDGATVSRCVCSIAATHGDNTKASCCGQGVPRLQVPSVWPASSRCRDSQV